MGPVAKMYRLRAQECDEKANLAIDTTVRDSFIEMAAEYRKLANKADGMPTKK